MGVATSTASMLYSAGMDAAAERIVSGGVSSVTSIFENQEELDVTLSSIRHQLLTMQCAINATRGQRITDQELLEKRSLIINAYHFGNYYYRTIKHRYSHPLLVECEGTHNWAIPAAKRRRTIRTFLCGDEELKQLNYIHKLLKSIDVQTFYAMVNAQRQVERPLKMYLYMDNNRLFSRDMERQQVINFLFEPSKTGENNVTVLPIIGPMGVGKTSLALHCFYDPKVQDHFSLKICTFATRITSDTNDGFPIIFSDILEKCNSMHITDDENTLLVMLKQELSCERFLLMIDDVFGSVDNMVWNALWDCLRCGKQGSKVIYISNTVQYNTCKKIINSEAAVMPVMLDGFSEEEYLMFFQEHAFGGADPEDYPKLAKIGRGIAKKMNGSI